MSRLIKIFALSFLAIYTPGCAQLMLAQLDSHNRREQDAFYDAVGQHLRDESLVSVWDYWELTGAPYKNKALAERYIKLALYTNGEFDQLVFYNYRATHSHGTWSHVRDLTVALPSGAVDLSDKHNLFVSQLEPLRRGHYPFSPLPPPASPHQ